MSARYRQSLLFRLSVLTLALVAAGWLCPQPAAADGLDKLDTSLKLIPEDAAFYSSMMRNREQFEAIRHSNALAKIQEMPIVQMGLAFYNMQLATPGSNVAKIDAALREPGEPQGARPGGGDGLRRNLHLRRQELRRFRASCSRSSTPPRATRR